MTRDEAKAAHVAAKRAERELLLVARANPTAENREAYYTAKALAEIGRAHV